MSIHSTRLLPVSLACLFTLVLLTLPAGSLRAQTAGPVPVRHAPGGTFLRRMRRRPFARRGGAGGAALLGGCPVGRGDARVEPVLRRAFTAVFDRVDTSVSGFVWVGHIADTPMSSVTLAVEGTTVYGIVLMPGRSYLVKPAGNGISAIVETDQVGFPAGG